MSNISMTGDELLRAIDKLKSIMIAVATGGPRIGEVQSEFEELYDSIATELSRRKIDNPMPYRDLWQWYGRWSSGDLPTYASRRTFVAEAYAPAIQQIKTGRGAPYSPTGWDRVDRTVTSMRERLASAAVEEDFQGIGLLAREALISVAQAVFDPEKHPTADNVAASTTDAKRMLEAYVAKELGGERNEPIRKHAKAALELALHLQHKRTASFREAAACVEATTSVINLIAIFAGRRDPS